MHHLHWISSAISSPSYSRLIYLCLKCWSNPYLTLLCRQEYIPCLVPNLSPSLNHQVIWWERQEIISAWRSQSIKVTGDVASDALKLSSDPTVKGKGDRELYQASLKQHVFHSMERFLSYLEILSNPFCGMETGVLQQLYWGPINSTYPYSYTQRCSCHNWGGGVEFCMDFLLLLVFLFGCSFFFCFKRCEKQQFTVY